MAGLRVKLDPLMTGLHRKACSSRRCRNSRAIGRQTTTGANARRRLNALPQFITEIDGLDIHFIHVRSKHENALPLIVTHGWPGSVVEQLKIIDPLTNPTAHGGSASDAFDVVIPSMPGYGFSGKPTTTGWDPVRIARAWAVLMKRLGYSGTSRKAAIGVRLSPSRWACRRRRNCSASTSTCAAAVPAEICPALASHSPPPGLSADEKLRVRTARLPLQPRPGVRSRRWRPARKRCTALRIRRSAWPPGSSTMTCAATSSSHASSTVSPRA